MPAFSVVLATYNRGEHILPTVHSVLAQTCQDFELLIVGDCCTDATGTVLQPYLGERVHWLNLNEHGGSQSFPNNAGIERAQGDHIAYIGHDDLWAPDHLERLEQLFRHRPEVDFGVSGCICHPPPGTSYCVVSGLFDDDEAKFQHFFPPSSFAHTRSCIDKIGPWRIAAEIRAPVDADLLLRAAGAGLVFASTQVVTVHKFVASWRYLSYIRHQSEEQELILARMQEPGFNEAIAAMAEDCRRRGTFMSLRHPDYDAYAEGELAHQNALRKGVMRAELRRLSGSQTLVQNDEPRGLDWLHFAAEETRLRWSHASSRPKILIPFTAEAPVRLRLQLAARNRDLFKAIRFELNGHEVAASLENDHPMGSHFEATAVMDVPLLEDDYSILTLILPEPTLRQGAAGLVGLAEIALDQSTDDVQASLDELLARRLFAALAESTAALEKACAEHQTFAKAAARQLASANEGSKFHERRVAEMKATMSWRLTAPLREIRRAALRLFRIG